MTPTRLVTSVLVVLAVVSASGQAPAPVPSSVAADFVWPGGTAAVPAAVTHAVAAVSVDAIGSHMTALSSVGFGGRGLGQPGLDATAEYVASMLVARGIRPLRAAKPGEPARGAYFQAVPIRELSTPTGQVTVETSRGGATESRVFLAGVDCVFAGGPPAVVTAPVVFAGHGVRETSLGRDEYLGLDVRDRVVVVFDGLPPVETTPVPALRKYAHDNPDVRNEARADVAATLGARALVIIETERLPLLEDLEDATPEKAFVGMGDAPLPVVRVSASAGRALLGLAPGADVATKPQSVSGVAATVRTAATERLVVARNVIAAIPGSDPALREQAVIIGAHMDHLGRAESGFYPGADDNASGTAALLEMAAVFAAAERPKRTVIVAFWTGEEEGHHGSEFYITHPLWPVAKTSVYLNLDMIAHPWLPEEIRTLVTDSGLPDGAEFLKQVRATDFTEVGVPPTARDLDPVLTKAARAAGLALHFDRTDGRFGGSDYRAFARQSRPFVRFFGNFFPGYHETTDTIEDAKPEQVIKIARFALAAAWLLANQ